jgi:hypothetical protein
MDASSDKTRFSSRPATRRTTAEDLLRANAELGAALFALLGARMPLDAVRTLGGYSAPFCVVSLPYPRCVTVRGLPFSTFFLGRKVSGRKGKGFTAFSGDRLEAF